MKINKRARWMISLIVSMASLVVIFTQADSVRATITGLHAFKVYVRVQTEIMQKTPAGRYYEALFWKYNDEMIRIMQAHPEHRDAFFDALLIFVPELEALLNGDGDKAYITSEHMASLKAELEWFASVGSPALKDDIQREQQRLALEVVVGMNMNEALNYINSTWIPGPQEGKTLVVDSGGKWAFYVHDGVYFEYPANFLVQESESENGYLYLIPFAGSPDTWNPCVIKIRVWSMSSDQWDADNPRSWYSPESIVWENPIPHVQFPGVEFVSRVPDSPVVDFHAYQYNEENQLAVDIWVFVFQDSELSDAVDYTELIARRYEYFQHIVASLRVQQQ